MTSAQSFLSMEYSDLSRVSIVAVLVNCHRSRSDIVGETISCFSGASLARPEESFNNKNVRRFWIILLVKLFSFKSWF